MHHGRRLWKLEGLMRIPFQPTLNTNSMGQNIHLEVDNYPTYKHIPCFCRKVQSIKALHETESSLPFLQEPITESRLEPL